MAKIFVTGFGHSKQLSLNKFFDPSTPSMRKGRDRGKNGENKGGKGKRLMIIVATTSFPAVDRPNAAHSCQYCSDCCNCCLGLLPCITAGKDFAIYLKIVTSLQKRK